MAAVRKIPDHYDPEAKLISGSGIFFLLPVVLLNLCILNFDRKTFLDWIGILAALIIGLCLMMIPIIMIMIGFSKFEENREWLKTTSTALTTIVEREEISNVDEYGVLMFDWRLGLKMLPSQTTICPGESIVWMYVSKSLYKKYANKEIVCVYYSPETPLTFLLKDEL
jgi:hypothetical protein